jgi:hypothetical protein
MLCIILVIQNIHFIIYYSHINYTDFAFRYTLSIHKLLFNQYTNYYLINTQIII